MSRTETSPHEVVAALAHGTRLRRRFRLGVAALCVALLVAATWGASVGSVDVPFAQVWAILWRHVTMSNTAPTDFASDTIIWQIRLPRVVLGGLVGAGLAVVGVAVQAMVRNPLADPYVLGVESGAAAGAVAVIYLGRTAAYHGVVTPAIGGFAGAGGTLLLVFALARQRGRVSSVRLLLVGVALSYALSGLTSFVLYSSREPAARSAVLFWILGGLGGAEWSLIPTTVGAVAAGALVVWYHARQLNALALGDESAVGLGTDPDRLRTRLLVLCSLVVAVLVSVAGPIGFIGLVVPHVARMVFGAEHRRLIPASVLLGAIYLILVDIACRALFAPTEVPIGVMTAVLGTPFFLWLLRRRGTSALRDAT